MLWTVYTFFYKHCWSLRILKMTYIWNRGSTPHKKKKKKKRESTIGSLYICLFKSIFSNSSKCQMRMPPFPKAQILSSIPVVAPILLWHRNPLVSAFNFSFMILPLSFVSFSSPSYFVACADVYFFSHGWVVWAPSSSGFDAPLRRAPITPHHIAMLSIGLNRQDGTNMDLRRRDTPTLKLMADS